MGKKEWKKMAEDRRRTIQKITNAKMEDTVQISLDESCPVYVKVVGKQDCNTGELKTAEETECAICQSQLKSLKEKHEEVKSTHISAKKVRNLLLKTFKKYEDLLKRYKKSLSETEKCQSFYDDSIKSLEKCSSDHLNDVKKFHNLLKTKQNEDSVKFQKNEMKKEEALMLHARIRQGRWILIMLVLFICFLLIVLGIRYAMFFGMKKMET